MGNLPTMICPKFATDIPSLTEWGEPFLLEVAGIDPRGAHANERISKKELLECVDLYVDLAENLVRQLESQPETSWTGNAALSSARTAVSSGFAGL